MYIDRLKFYNFGVFSGLQEIKFSTQKAHNLTVIFAANSGGKTTIMRGLRFLFYGTYEDKDGGGIETAISHKAIAAKQARNIIESYVEATIFHGDKKYTVRRTIKASKDAEDLLACTLVEVPLSMIFHEGRRDVPEHDQTKIEGLLSRIIPESLSQFFFFEGESLAKLIEQKDTKLAEALSSVFYQDQLVTLDKNIAAVKKEITQELAGVAAADRDFRILKSRIDALDAILDKDRELLLGLVKEKDELERCYAEWDQKLQGVLSKDNRALGDDLKKLRAEQVRLSDVVSEAESEYRSKIGLNGVYILLRSKFHEAHKILDALHEKKQLPADISSKFLAELLAGKDPTCICGTSIKKGTAARKKIEALQLSQLTTRLSTELFVLYGKLSVENVSPDSMYVRTASDLKEINNQQKRINDALNKQGKIEHEISLKENIYDPSISDDVDRLRANRESCRHQKSKVESKIKDAEFKIRDTESTVSSLRRQLGQLPVSPEIGSYGKMDAAAADFKRLVSVFKSKIREVIHKQLEDITNKVYLSIMTDGSIALVNNETFMPFVRLHGIDGVALGGAQRQILTISFIMALNFVRTTIAKALTDNGFQVGKIHEQCCFFDSVFAPVDEDFRRPLTMYLPKKMKQLVILVASQQWDESIAEGLGENIDEVFICENYAKERPDPNSMNSVVFKRQEYTLRFYDKACDHAFSKVRKI